MPVQRPHPPAHPVSDEHGDGRHREDGRGGHGVRLGEGQRLEQPSLLGLEGEEGQERDGDDEQREEQGGPTSRVASATTCQAAAATIAGEVLVGVLDHDDGGIHHRADGDGDAAEGHDVDVQPLGRHHDECAEDADGQRDDRHQRAAHVKQEEEAHQGDDQQLLEEADAEAFDGTLDESAAVVGHLDRDALGQARSHGGEPGLDVLDHLERAGAVPHDDDATHGLALAVPLGEAPAHLGTDADGRDVPEQDGRAGGVDAERDLADVVRRGDVAAAADHELLLGGLEEPSADVAVAVLHGGADPGDGHPVRAQPVGIHRDLVLPDEAADARHLGHAGDAGQLVLQEPVLDRTQFGEVVPIRLERVHERPADAGGVRPERRRHARRQGARHVAQGLQDAAPRPVQVRAVLEDDVHEREAEEGIRAHGSGVRNGEQLRRERIGHLVFDDARGLSRVLGEDDDLHVGEVGIASSGARQRACTPITATITVARTTRIRLRMDQPTSRSSMVAPQWCRWCAAGASSLCASPPRGSPRESCEMAARRLLSESMRNCDETTTRSPGRAPR